jgi:hypothetical protein
MSDWRNRVITNYGPSGQLVLTPVGVEKLFSRDFTNEIRSQVIESSFAAGAEIHTNYCFGSFFNSHS